MPKERETENHSKFVTSYELDKGYYIHKLRTPLLTTVIFIVSYLVITSLIDNLIFTLIALLLTLSCVIYAIPKIISAYLLMLQKDKYSLDFYKESTNFILYQSPKVIKKVNISLADINCIDVVKDLARYTVTFRYIEKGKPKKATCYLTQKGYNSFKILILGKLHIPLNITNVPQEVEKGSKKDK